MEWIQTAREAPYFQTESGVDWTPVGHNDAITWESLRGCYRRKDMAAVERYLVMLTEHGVTMLRVMLEYNHYEHRYLEKPAGRFVPAMVRFWDDLIPLCSEHGIRLLLTPFDTFWLWIRWKRHPYNRENGGPVADVKRMLVDPEARAAIKRRMEFATTRWGGSGVVFAWDLWNELHPAMAEDLAEPIHEFIEDLSSFVRRTEQRVHGREHLQTVSIFGPLGLKYPVANHAVLTHACLDFATTHFYEHGTIDDPRNTVDAAIGTGNLMREALRQTVPGRAFFDSESGPIHSFKDHHKTLPAAFDDEYFRHMQWAHFASGGAGGGMRWPNRRPHILTPGMHRAQRGLSAFLGLIDWGRFGRRNWNQELQVISEASIAAFACGDRSQAVVWLLRRDLLTWDGRVRRDEVALVEVTLPEMDEGDYTATLWDTAGGKLIEQRCFVVSGGTPTKLTDLPVWGDLAIAIR